MSSSARRFFAAVIALFAVVAAAVPTNAAPAAGQRTWHPTEPTVQSNVASLSVNEKTETVFGFFWVQPDSKREAIEYLEYSVSPDHSGIGVHINDNGTTGVVYATQLADAGDYVVTISATDAGGDNHELEIPVSVNGAPTVTSNPGEIFFVPGEADSATVTAEDADGTIASFELKLPATYTAPGVSLVKTSATTYDINYTGAGGNIFHFLPYEAVDNDGARTTGTIMLQVGY